MILASQSQSRATMLRNAGVTIQIEPARIDEAAIKSAMLAEDAPPRDIADMLAEMKALRVSPRHPEELTLGADQILVCEGQIFDKPTDMAAARAHLQTLRGKTHQLLSAAVIAQRGEPIWRHIATAKLTMRPFSDSFLDDYLARFGETALTSVGAYHLEGLGAQLFSRIEGDYFTILGLPLLEILGFLRARGELIE